MQQIRYKLKQAQWPGTSNKVFADESIIVTVGPDQNAMWQRRFPLAMIRPGNSVADPTADEDPRYLRQTINVRLVQMVPGDDVGEMCLLGAHQPELQDGVSGYTQSKTTSSGKGLLQVEEVVLDTLKILSPADGVFMVCRSKGGADAVLDGEMGYVCWRDYSFEAELTVDRTFPSGVDFRNDGGTLRWTNPGTRYDFVKVMVRGGSLADVATHTGGAEVYVGTGESVGASGGAAFGLFAIYDDYKATPTDTKDVSPVSIAYIP